MAGSSGRQKAASRPTKASKRVPAEKLPDLKYAVSVHRLSICSRS